MDCKADGLGPDSGTAAVGWQDADGFHWVVYFNATVFDEGREATQEEADECIRAAYAILR